MNARYVKDMGTRGTWSHKAGGLPNHLSAAEKWDIFLHVTIFFGLLRVERNLHSQYRSWKKSTVSLTTGEETKERRL